MVSVELHNLGHVELHRGNVDAARRCFEELEAPARGSDEFDTLNRMNRAALALADGDRGRASELLDSVEATLAETGMELPPDDQFELDRLRRQLKS